MMLNAVTFLWTGLDKRKYSNSVNSMQSHCFYVKNYRDLLSIFINVNSLTAKCLNHAQPNKIILKLILNWFSVDTSLSSREFWVIMHVNSFTVISLWDAPYGKVHISCLVHVAWLFWASSLILNLHFQKMLRAPFVCELQRAAFSSPEPLLMYWSGLCCLDSSNILSAESPKQKKIYYLLTILQRQFLKYVVLSRASTWKLTFFTPTFKSNVDIWWGPSWCLSRLY